MFNWFDKLLVKIAKKILNRYAPKGEFIAYINKQEEKNELPFEPVSANGVKTTFRHRLRSQQLEPAPALYWSVSSEQKRILMVLICLLGQEEDLQRCLVKTLFKK